MYRVALRSAKERSFAERKATLVSEQGRGGVSVAKMRLVGVPPQGIPLARPAEASAYPISSGIGLP